jgi:hypothetical protein
MRRNDCGELGSYTQNSSGTLSKKARFFNENSPRFMNQGKAVHSSSPKKNFLQRLEQELPTLRMGSHSPVKGMEVFESCGMKRE